MFGSGHRGTRVRDAVRRCLGFEALEPRNLLAVSFDVVGSFNGLSGQAKVLDNPTSLEFGPDERLYVSEQNGSINAFTVINQQGQYSATAHEELLLVSGEPVVKSIQNHDDFGVPVDEVKRQVTGLVTAGTAEHPVLYVSSSNPLIAENGDLALDTNSGVVTRVSWTGTAWETVDIVRGLPRSEENHSVNGMELSADETKLYLQVGGNTNNGAPSQFFSYTGEYALSGALLEIDLTAIDQLPVLSDPNGGQNGASRQYVYDLPTLDDPTVANDGVREDANGMDVLGPWGGNDGFNMAILPSDAPLRIFADGLRNPYDVVLTEAGRFYTVDNGSNGNLGDEPIADAFGAATQLPNNGGAGAPEPLFHIEDGGYYGHPNPTRSNQDLSWTVYDDAGNPDAALSPNAVTDLSTRVPSGLAGQIPTGFVIAPSKFTSDASRLEESGVRVAADDPLSKALLTLGTSSNGLTEYTATAFDGALQGALVTTQFNGNVTLLNLNAAGTAVEPLVGPGGDDILGTADDEIVDADGIYPLTTGLSQPLDVSMGPGGTLWVTEFGPDNIKVLSPTDLVLPGDPDFDNDGLLNPVDPFLRDPTNGGQLILPGQTYRWDFDANQDDNLPGPNGYGGGLTGVMVNGSTDFELFFQEDSPREGQIINLDNVKFTTAAGGGTTVIEHASNGDATATQNDGEFLFHTGVTIAPTVETFNVRWTLFNPGDAFTGSSQQIGGYIGTGQQSNFLKVVATKDPSAEIQIVLENADVPSTTQLQADDLFNVAEVDSKKIFIDLEIDPAAETATPTITYETAAGHSTVSGTPISLSGTAVLEAIRGDFAVQGETTGLAVGLYSSNAGQLAEDTFQAIFDEIEISSTGDAPTTLYRVNAGGPELSSLDDGPNWSEDTSVNPSPFISVLDNNGAFDRPGTEAGATVPASTPGAVFHTERDDKLTPPNLAWSFETPVPGFYEVRLYMANGCSCTDTVNNRVFDVAIEGEVPANLDDIDLTAQLGHAVGGMFSNIVDVQDGAIDIEFLPFKKRPLINGIEIILLPSLAIGAAELSINVDSDLVQKSSFGPGSFSLTNSGEKNVSRVDIDLSSALYPDMVFDPLGLAGDTVSKQLQINTAGATGVVDPGTYEPYTGTGGIDGYEGLTLLFSNQVDDGFQPGETVGFSIDVDPNSIAGALKATLDAGTNPSWDVGGVSGAELIGSVFTVTFDDGTTATGQLQGANNQAGSRGFATQASPGLTTSLTVNGLSAGQLGTYTTDGPSVLINGPAGKTARVVLTKGIVQPVANLFDEPYASQLDAQLVALAASKFPVNNAAEFQTVDVLLTGAPQDISAHFNFMDVPIYDLAVDEDKLPLGFVAGIIDPAEGDLPLGPVSNPVYLQFDDGLNAPPVASDDAFAVSSALPINGNVFANNGQGPDFDPDVSDTIAVSAVNGMAVVDQLVALPSGATVIVAADGSFTYDPNNAFNYLLSGEQAIDQFQYTITDGLFSASAVVSISVVGEGQSNGVRFLVPDDAADERFVYDAEGSLIENRSLDPDNGISRGIAVAEDGSAYWVVDSNKNVYHYNSEDVLLHQWQFTDFAVPEGIAVSGTDLWIVSRQTDQVYFFAGGTGLTDGTHSPTSSFSLDSSNDVPFGLTTDGESLWVVNDATEAWKVFEYSLAGSLLGSWDLDSSNRNARGIALDPDNRTDLLVVNSGALDQVFRYEDAIDQTAGSLTAAESFSLDVSNSSPQGLAAFVAVATTSADFDSDGDVDGADFLAWQRGLNQPDAHPSDGDANDDQEVNALDLTVWKNQFRSAPISASADFDQDSDIDGADFLTWQRGLNTSLAMLSDGDANRDEVVDAVDLDVWQNQFGTSPLFAPAASQDEVNETQPTAFSTSLIDAALARLWLGTPLVPGKPESVLDEVIARDSASKLIGSLETDSLDLSNSTRLRSFRYEERHAFSSIFEPREEPAIHPEQLSDEWLERVFG